MDWLGIVHFVAALLSLAAGFLVVVTRKGTRRHKFAGRAYAGAMAAVVVTAFMIYDLFDGFGPFHFAALVSGITVTAGVVPALLRRPKKMWIAHHAYWMAWSYVGLLAAAASEVATRYLHIPFGRAVGIATLAVVAAGWLVIKLRVPVILQNFGIDVKKPENAPAE